MPLHLFTGKRIRKTQVDDIAIYPAPISWGETKLKNQKKEMKIIIKSPGFFLFYFIYTVYIYVFFIYINTCWALFLSVSLTYTNTEQTHTAGFCFVFLCSGYSYLLHQISVWNPKRSSTTTLMDHRTSQA